MTKTEPTRYITILLTLPTIAVVALLLFVRFDFGQREHMFVIFVLPWLVLRAAIPPDRDPPAWLAILVAVWACPGLFVKPVFVLLPVAVVAAQAWRRRSLRCLFAPDILAMGGLGMVYAAAVPIAFPEYSDVVEFALAYYGFYSETLSDVEVTDFLLRSIQPSLSTLKGVAEAEILGGKTYSMRVWMDPVRMSALKVSAADIVNAIGSENYQSAAGNTRGDLPPTLKKGREAYFAIKALYDDFNKLASSDTGFAIAMEIQGTNESYARLVEIEDEAGDK